MLMSIGKRGDYAVRATLSLARAYGDGRRKSRQIAAQMEIPERFLPQIMTSLIRAALVASVAGPDGGYVLTRPPEDICLLEVIEATEGPIKSERCVLRGGPCHWDIACAVHPAWFEAQEAMKDKLRATTFAALARTDEDLEAGHELQPPRSV